ncbi:(Trans)glycosidase [Venustampulla echinocandica]|uniref:glucan 1,3-beta-glucosidase n=1 Tax=Venustampulla echinocandica TaxID=2656787 RepID=A0A370TNU1_9HELO|nr:(Trans)glycosidase [Venustampulla echinocandica]RDL37190.1 (Trans)glycosidase [Venustampulla echinocandica]
MAPGESPRRKTRERSHPHHERRRSQPQSPKKPAHESTTSQSSSQALSADSLARLNLLNQHERARARAEETTPKKPRRKRHREVVDEKIVVERSRRQHKRKKRRVVSGALLEEGEGPRLKGLRGGHKNNDEHSSGKKKKKQRLCGLPFELHLGVELTFVKVIIGGVLLVLIIIIVAVAVVVSKKKGSKSDSSSNASTNDSGKPSNSNLDGISQSDIPVAAKGTDLDPFSWYDTTDFNVTYTNETVGGLPIMGLNSEWDDSKSANGNVPPIGKPWGSYSETPARGVNLGGWLSLEPFITPSLFNKNGVIDEWTLTTYLGNQAKPTLEQHYATFVSEQTFIDIANAGLDHVRIPFSYWAVKTYDGDPYVFRTSWRYLLRAIEWARKHGLRINLDVHGLPGSQNGWNHSGRQGSIGWLNGTDGALNGQRSLDLHDQLSKFFAQDRYKNIISFYGLANEPKMTVLQPSDVIAWTSSAYTLVRKNGINANVVFGDGFGGLLNWKGKLTGLSGLVLDAHQYVIFNRDQISFNHSAKIDYACRGWSDQASLSSNTATGFGPTLFAEWSQADTDCAPNLNNVGLGSRWEGKFLSGDPQTQVLSPGCPAKSASCSCSSANADPSTYSSAYKEFLQMFAEAQMHSFEKGWGWFYWTWKTESAAQWSYQAGLKAGILPAKAYEPKFKCEGSAPSFDGLPETY